MDIRAMRGARARRLGVLLAAAAVAVTAGCAGGGSTESTDGMANAGSAYSTHSKGDSHDKGDSHGKGESHGGSNTHGKGSTHSGSSTHGKGSTHGGTSTPTQGSTPPPSATPTPSPSATSGSTSTTSKITPLPVTGGVDYQLGGAYTPPSGVTVVVRDASAEPAAGVYSICYINGFQTQADQASEWTGQHAGLLLHDSKGKVVSDPNWPGEYVLDPSTAANRAGILAIMQPLITGCANDGYKAVEFDNLDTFTRFSSIPESGTAALAQAYTAAAHKAGLAAAQKNAAEYSRTAHDDWGFDFAIAEECHVYDECGQYTSVYGQRVVEVEYPDDLKVSFDSLCSASDRVPLLVERDRDLVTPSDRGYLRRAC